LEIEIERLVHRGLGLARAEGKTIFVPAVIPGETVLCTIEREKKSFAFGRVKKILKPSPHRVIPECAYFQECGGCQLAHIDYQHQLQIKSEVLAETLRRGAGFDPATVLEPIVPSPAPLQYRTRLRLHVLSGETGFKAFQTDKFVKVADCLLACKELRQAIPALKGLLRELRAEKNFEIELDFDPASAKVFALVSARKRSAWLLERGRFIKAGPDEKGLDRLLSFVQVNPEQNQKLVELVAGLAGSARAKTCLELFAGAGNLSFELAGKVDKLVSVEINRSAVRLANQLKMERKVGNVEFVAQASENYLDYALRAGLRFDLVVLDPPRTGAKKEAVKIAGLNPRAIIYVSCEPSTLARDLKTMLGAGYRAEKIIPIDMFPQTFHIETITLLTRGVKP